MEQFEYSVTKHQSEAFSSIVYFCSSSGDCDLGQVPAEVPEALVDVLNSRGAEGWELVQLFLGRGGVIACWKRKVLPDSST